MSQVLQPIQKILWREGLSLFYNNWKEWTKWATGFFALLVLSNFLTVQKLGLNFTGLIDIIGSNPKDFKDQIQALPKPNQLITFSQTFLFYIQAYFFNIFYLRRAHIVRPPDLGIKGFFYAIGQRLLSYLIMLAWMFLAMLPAGIVMVIATTVSGRDASAIIAITAFGFSLLIAAVMVYVVTRYSLVYPLASEKIGSSLKVSTKLVQGNMWRLIGNFFLIFILVVFLGLLQWGAIFAVGYHADNSVISGLASLFMAAAQVVTGGVLSAFACAAARILYAEKQSVDPAFKLV